MRRYIAICAIGAFNFPNHIGEDARKKGDKVQTGGYPSDEKGNFFEPVVFTELDKSATAMNVEPFGPLAIINPFKFPARCTCAAMLAVSLAYASGSMAQNYPSRQITIVVPVPPGGGTDTFARLFAQKLAASFARTVIVDNRPGAANVIGTEAVVRAAPDGHTLLYVAAVIAQMTTFHSKLAFDPRRDLAPITMTVSIPQVLVSHPSLPARNVKELLALAKAKPGALAYGSSGVGSAGHLAMGLFKLKTGIEANHVPYRGAAPMQVALLSGETQFTFLVIPLVQAHLKTGKMRAHGLSAMKRSSILPDIPTLDELGVKDFEALQWHSFFAPAKVPPPIIDLLHREIVKALASADIRDRLAIEGAEIVGSSPREFASYFAADTAKWADVVKRSGMKLE